MLTQEHKKKIEYLNQYKYLNKNIDRKIKELEGWRSKILNVTGSISDMPRSGKRSNAIEDGIAAIDEIEQNINQDIDNLIDLRKEIEDKIESVKDLKLRELLKCRYLDCQSWEEVAFKSGYSWQHTYRLHEKALDQINL